MTIYDIIRVIGFPFALKNVGIFLKDVCEVLNLILR